MALSSFWLQKYRIRSSLIKFLSEFSSFGAAAAGTAGGPVFPSVATPLEDHFGAMEILAHITWSKATVALVPVHAVDLEESDIIGSVVVIQLSISITAALMVDDALAAFLTPARVLRAPVRNIHIVLRIPTFAISA